LAQTIVRKPDEVHGMSSSAGSSKPNLRSGTGSVVFQP
jgi:hypothetical protein